MCLPLSGYETLMRLLSLYHIHADVKKKKKSEEVYTWYLEEQQRYHTGLMVQLFLKLK